jgi:hypothetical protein
LILQTVTGHDSLNAAKSNFSTRPSRHGVEGGVIAVVTTVVMVRPYRFSRPESISSAMLSAVVITLAAEEEEEKDSAADSDSGTKGGGVLGMSGSGDNDNGNGGSGGIRLGEGTRGVYDIRREDFRGRGGGSGAAWPGLQSWSWSWSWREGLSDEEDDVDGDRECGS